MIHAGAVRGLWTLPALAGVVAICAAPMAGCSGPAVTSGRAVTQSVSSPAATKVTETIPVDFPHAMAVDPATNHLFVLSGDSALAVIDLTTGFPDVVDLGDVGPQDLVFDSDTRTIYVVGGAMNAVTVVDATTREVKGAFPVGDYHR